LEDSGLSSVRVLRLGIPDRFVEQGRREEVLRILGLDGRGIAESIREWLRSEGIWLSGNIGWSG